MSTDHDRTCLVCGAVYASIGGAERCQIDHITDHGGDTMATDHQQTNQRRHGHD